MNFYRPLHYFFGEYVFKTDMKRFSRFATLLAQKRLHFWGVRAKEDDVFFRVSIFTAEEITKIAKDADVPLELAEKKGIPFIFSRYRKRYGLMVGLAAGLFLMLWAQLFVWKITVSGNTEMSVSEIERALDECGISVGCFIPDIDTQGDANRLLMHCGELSSVAISINGTHVNVSVLERTAIPEIIDDTGFFNVVAERDGVIIDINAADGTPEVNEGDVVYAGELLINSFIEGNNGSYRPTHARGSVYAAVSETFISKIPLSRITKVYTGNTETKYIYTVLGQEMPSFSGAETDYEYFDAVATERIVELFGFIELPIKEFRVIYSEYQPVETPIDEETAEALAYGELSDFLAEADLELLSCEASFDVDKENGICILVANAVFKQDIAREVPFEILNYKISERFPNALE